MPSQEATILADFLLTPAGLRDFLTLKQFTEIFPRSYQSNPAVKEMYQELQRLRQQDLDTVRQNITEEIKRSKALKRACAREREQDDRSAVAGLDPVALQIEEELSGYGRRRKPHTLQSIHPSIKEACANIEAEIADKESEIEDTLSEVQEVIGELSDLRYGSFSKSASGEDISEEVLATLKRLEATGAKSSG